MLLVTLLSWLRFSSAIPRFMMLSPAPSHTSPVFLAFVVCMCRRYVLQESFRMIMFLLHLVKTGPTEPLDDY